MVNVKKFAYIRVSSKDQNEDRQIDTMLALGVNERDLFIDKASGKNTDRPRYQAMKAVLRPGDTVIFDSITRMSRNMDDTKKEFEWFVSEGIALEFIQEPMLNTAGKDGDDVLQRAISDIILTLLAAFAEKEREDTRIRQREGIDAAQRRGKHLGRPRISYDTLSKVQQTTFINEYKRWKAKEQTAVQTFDNLEMTKSTFYKVVKEYETTTK